MATGGGIILRKQWTYGEQDVLSDGAPFAIATGSVFGMRLDTCLRRFGMPRSSSQLVVRARRFMAELEGGALGGGDEFSVVGVAFLV